MGNYNKGEFMERQQFEKNTIVQHFKRSLYNKDGLSYLYRIICHAEHTETKRMFVVYQSLETNKIYIRPMEMFYSFVDNDKYPEAKQTYKFEIYRKK